MRRLLIVAALLTLATPARVSGQQPARIVIGLYAPSAPFAGTQERLRFVSSLAEHMQAKSGLSVSGRVFARAGDFAAAVKKGEVQFAVVEAAYGADRGWDVLGAAVLGGSSRARWQLVAGAGVSSLASLKGKTVIIPALGGRESAFVYNALLDGHVPSGWFNLTTAPDAGSAVAAVGVGRADAAIVPSGGLELPAGVSRVIELEAVPWPMFAAMPGAGADAVKTFAAALPGFKGDEVFGGFAAAGAGEYATLVKRMAPRVKRGPMAVPPPAQLDARGLLGGRSFAIEPSDLAGAVQPRR